MSTRPALSTDPATFEVLKNTQIHIVREMGLVMQRASFSVVFSEGLDFSCALYDATGQMLAQAENIPAHLGVQRLLLQNSLKEIGPENIEDGDALLSNDPYFGGSHFPDLTVMLPIFYRGEFIAVAANLAHHTDMGGMVPGSFSPSATENFQEALQLPPVKIMRAGAMQRDVLEIIRRNVRLPDDVTADLRAQIASLKTGEKRMVTLVDKYGLEVWKRFNHELLTYSETRMKEGIHSLPPGTYRFEDYMDNDGIELRPYKIAVTVRVRPDKVLCDFTGSDPQAKGAINSPYGFTLSAAVVAVKCVADPYGPANEGMFRPIEIVAPSGTIVNPVRPAPITGGLGETSNRVAGAVWGALAQAVPGRVTACQGCSDNNLFVAGTDPGTQQLYILYDYPEVGWGGRPFADGVNAIYSLHTGNCDNNLAEIYEYRWPVLMRRYSLREGTGGPGKWRGGLGIVKEYTTWPPHETTVTALADHTKFEPYGLFGGKGGAPGRWTVISPRGAERPLSPYGGKASRVPLKAGEILRLETPSGGGYGPPFERDPERVLSDVRDGYVTVQQAARDYGVVIDARAGRVDERATAILRRRTERRRSATKTHRLR